MKTTDYTVKDWYRNATDNVAHLVTINLLWFFFSILIITAPPAAAGLFYATNNLAHGNTISWRTFFEGFLKYFWLGWQWIIVNIGTLFITGYLLFHLSIYKSDWSSWIQGIMIALLMIWLIAQFYTFPLVIEQSDHRLSYAYWNSLVLMIRTPGAWFLSGLSILAIIIFGSVFFLPAWGFIIASLIAYISNRGAILQIQRVLHQPTD
jgi:hypothetical protein